jgi:hypothetical protein
VFKQEVEKQEEDLQLSVDETPQNSQSSDNKEHSSQDQGVPMVNTQREDSMNETQMNYILK